MKQYQTILFDLDGTLTDPAEGIAASFVYALENMHLPVPDKKTLTRFIGPPLLETFERDFSLNASDARKALRYYREYFGNAGIFENVLYDGIEHLLERLCAGGKTLLVATSKPEPYAVRILEHFGIAGFFTYIAGSTLEETRTKKADVIRYALSVTGIPANLNAVMVGDRRHDVEGAKEVGIDSIGVLYGYGTRDELQCAGVTYLAETVNALEALLI